MERKCKKNVSLNYFSFSCVRNFHNSPILHYKESNSEKKRNSMFAWFCGITFLITYAGFQYVNRSFDHNKLDRK